MTTVKLWISDSVRRNDDAYDMMNPQVPKDFYVIEETHIDGIVIWQDATGVIYQTTPGSEPLKICNSLEDYIQM